MEQKKRDYIKMVIDILMMATLWNWRFWMLMTRRKVISLKERIWKFCVYRLKKYILFFIMFGFLRWHHDKPGGWGHNIYRLSSADHQQLALTSPLASLCTGFYNWKKEKNLRSQCLSYWIHMEIKWHWILGHFTNSKYYIIIN